MDPPELPTGKPSSSSPNKNTMNLPSTPSRSLNTVKSPSPPPSAQARNNAQIIKNTQSPSPLPAAQARNNAQSPSPQKRKILIYHDPKVINVTTPEDFKDVVQRLTGMEPPVKSTPEITVERTSPKKKPRLSLSNDNDKIEMLQETVQVDQSSGILSPKTLPQLPLEATVTMRQLPNSADYSTFPLLPNSSNYSMLLPLPTSMLPPLPNSADYSMLPLLPNSAEYSTLSPLPNSANYSTLPPLPNSAEYSTLSPLPNSDDYSTLPPPIPDFSTETWPLLQSDGFSGLDQPTVSYFDDMQALNSTIASDPSGYLPSDVVSPQPPPGSSN